MRFSTGVIPAGALVLSTMACDSDTAVVPEPPIAVQETIALPLRPEAVALGEGATFFAGSSNSSTDTTNHGVIYRGDLATGQGTILVPGVRTKATSGLAYDSRTGLLYAAETRAGTASAYNATTGQKVQGWTFPTNAAPGNLINDVVVSTDAVYFTNSLQPVIYRVALGAGSVPSASFTSIPLGGEYVHNAGAKPFGINSNGIAATADGRYVILDNMGANKGTANSNCIPSPRPPADSGCVSTLFRVDPATGNATRIDLGTQKVYFVDGIRLYDRTLYVTQNFLDKIAVFTLSADFLTATFVKEITNPGFVVPSSLVVFQNNVFVVNAGFGPGPHQLTRAPK